MNQRTHETTPTTADEHAKMVAHLSKPGQDIIDNMTPDEAELAHMGLLACTEAGELGDALKKFVFYKKPLDRENVVEEMGDLEFALARIRQLSGVSREEALKHNMNKLAKRYAGGFTDKQAHDRADKLLNT